MNRTNRLLKGKIYEHYGSQAEFADVADVHESFVSKVVRGRRSLPPEDQEKWARLLGVEREQLFGAQ